MKSLIPVLTFFFLSSSAFGAQFLSQQLLKDNSKKPPGDQVFVSVLLEPGEQNVLIQVQPFLLQEKGEAVALKNPKTLSPQVYEQNASRPKDARPDEIINLDITVTIPFEELNLSPGLQKVGYLVRGFTPKNGEHGEPFFSRPTEMTTFEILDEESTRFQLTLNPETPELAETLFSVTPTPAYFFQADGSVSKRAVEVTGVEIKVQEPMFGAEPGEVTVQGGYDRAYGENQTLTPSENSQKDDFTEQHHRIIKFATNRRIANPKARNAERFHAGAWSEELSYGAAQVNIPLETHVKGQLERGYWWWEKNDSTKAFFIEDGGLSLMPKDLFLEGIQSDDVLIYVHGFSETFESAVISTAQIQHDIRFAGEAITFSWATQGKKGVKLKLNGAHLAYHMDEETAEKTIPQFADFLADVFQKVGPDKIHILAHSMGNRVVLGGIAQLVRENRLEVPAGTSGHAIKSISLAAADVDINLFGAYLPLAEPTTDLFSFYYSKWDAALRLSNKIHTMQRAGMYPSFFEGMDTINCDAANSAFVGAGHSYVQGRDHLLLDLMMVVKYGRQPTRRQPPLGNQEQHHGFSYWPVRAPTGMKLSHLFTEKEIDQWQQENEFSTGD